MSQIGHNRPKKLLDKVGTPEELRQLPESDLKEFADQLRQEVIDKVSLAGGPARMLPRQSRGHGRGRGDGGLASDNGHVDASRRPICDPHALFTQQVHRRRISARQDYGKAELPVPGPRHRNR